MSSRWQQTALNLMKHLRDLVLTALILGSIQLLLAVLPWLALFRAYPHGFSMALTLVGFGGWFIAFATSIGVRRTMSRRPATVRPPSAVGQPPGSVPKISNPLVVRFQEQFERSGCGTILFLSSLMPLVLAFVLRLQADMQSGKTWNDIFPTMP